MEEKVKFCFRSLYGKDAQLLVIAPGRINLIGEHTDYNGGLVLPAAIDKYMYFLFSTNDSNKGNVYAMDLDESINIDLENLRKTNSTWANYFIGLLVEFKLERLAIKGFDCVFSSEIPIGAGMSSSAALECGFALGMDYINRAGLGNWEIINLSHRSNHKFMNIYGGIMDQFASLFGRAQKCMLLDCDDRTFEYKDLILNDHAVVLINTKVQHEHSSSGYNTRSDECKKIEALIQEQHPQLKKISDVPLNELNEISKGWPEHLICRAQYIVDENIRVLEFCKALKGGNIQRMGTLLYQSHDGLQHQFDVSCPELDLLVDMAKAREEVVGARMMGGGFGGCTINIMKSDKAEEITQDLMNKYHENTGIEAESYFVNISEGAKVVLL